MFCEFGTVFLLKVLLTASRFCLLQLLIPGCDNMDQTQSLGGPLLSLDVRTSGLSLQHQTSSDV